MEKEIEDDIETGNTNARFKYYAKTVEYLTVKISTASFVSLRFHKMKSSVIGW